MIAISTMVENCHWLVSRTHLPLINHDFLAFALRALEFASLESHILHMEVTLFGAGHILHRGCPQLLTPIRQLIKCLLRKIIDRQLAS